jgi:hypothetical protein
MKKALVILLALALVFGLVLTACDIGGGGGGGGKKPAPPPPPPPGGGDNPIVEGASYLKVGGRSENWHTFDIKAGKAGATANYTADKAHTITVYGNTTAGTATIRFANTDAPYGVFGTGDGSGWVTADGQGDFTLVYEFTWADITDAAQNIRIQLPATVSSFTIYEITIVDADGTSIYKMSEDPDIQEAEAGVDPIVDDTTGSTWFLKAGTPVIQVIVPGEEAPPPLMCEYEDTCDCEECPGPSCICGFVPEGTLFSLAAWLEGVADGEITGNLASPLQKAGSPTVTKAATGLTISGRTDDWNSVDVVVANAGLNFTGGKTYQILVTGTLTSAGTVKVAQSGSPYGTIVQQVLTAAGPFTLLGTLSETNVGTTTGLRIQTQDTEDFTITGIEIGVTLFSLDEWLVDVADGEITGNLASPLQKAGSPTVTKAATGLTISGRTDDWNSVDVVVANAGLNFAGDKTYQIVVTGTLTAAGTVKVAQSGSPYGTIVQQVLTAPGSFALVGVLSETNVGTTTGLRMQTQDTEDFTISKIGIWAK